MERKRERLIVAAVVLAAMFAVACRTAEVPTVDMQTREVRDDLGRVVRVPQNIERAVSLAPNLTEMIFAIGAGDRLVGVTTYCNYPPETAAIEKVGDTQTPNIEKIIALKPQIVFVSTASQLEAFTQTLSEQNIAVYVTNPATLDDIFLQMEKLGGLFGETERVSAVRTRLQGRVDLVRRSVSSRGDQPRPRVFVQISNEPLFTIGHESFLTALIERAGGISVTKDVATAYPKLSKETAAALDPDVIILSDSEDNRDPSSVFKDSKAVKNGRVYRINADIISRPGPRLVDALEEIASKLKEKNS